MPSKRTLFLIDGSSQMYRAYHAIRGLTGPDGRSTNAVYGFVTMLRKLLSDQQPDFIAASFDLPAPTFRSDLAADYKANRAAMPADLAEQVPFVHRATEALGVPILTSPGFEADDVIGTLAVQAAAAGYDVGIVTGDKDFYQLVNERIKVYNPRDEGTWYDAEGVKTKFGVEPAQVVDTLALMGDAIDNVKGVPGIGEKGARELISTFGSLDALLARAGDVPQKKYREALIEHADAARRSREILRIRTDVPLNADLERFRYQGASRERCFDLFTELGFRSLVMEFAPTAATIVKDYRRVDGRDALVAVALELRAAGRFAFRLIVDADAAMRARILGLAFSTAPRTARYVPIQHGLMDVGFEWREASEVLAPVFADPAVQKTGHDVKFDLVVLARHGVKVEGATFDSMLASYLLDATRSSHALEDAVLEHLTYRASSEEDVRGRGAKAVPMGQLSPDAVLGFAGERADLALQLADHLAPRLDQELAALLSTLEMPLVPILAEMELAGVRVDVPALAGQSQRIEAELATRSRQIFESAGEEFNINSPKQLSEILFDKLQLPALKRTGKTRAASTAVEVLEELALVHDLPRQILEWRGLQKLKGTYIDALPQLVHPETGRVHTSFNQAIAATGRLSSSDPNLQNIPIRSELGRAIRSAFVAEPGHLLISADYSQIELRVLAHLAGEEALIDAFRRGEDIHDRTAKLVFGTSSGLDAHELRRRAKIVNYALLYGKTAFTLAKDIGVSQQAAQEFIDAYFGGFPRVRGYIDRTLAEARETGIVKTLFGRRRLVPELNSRNGQVRAAAERVAVNLPIQGTAADIMKRAMLEVHAELDRRRGAGHALARMILTVHDELLLEAPEGDAQDVASVVADRMEHATLLTVPLSVDVGIGANWRDAKP